MTSPPPVRRGQGRAPVRFDVAGTPVADDRIATRPMNFGQPFPVDRTPLPWTLRLPIAEFCRWTEPDFTRLVDEMRQDIATAGVEDEDDFDARLLRLGWPSLETLIREQPALAEALLTEALWSEVLDAFTSAPLQDNDYLLNTFEYARAHGDDIVLKGTCHPRRGSVTGE